jgi:hypothetical protein
MRKPDTIYISTNDNAPTYFMTEPTTTRQGVWDEAYVPKSKLDEAMKKIEELEKPKELISSIPDVPDNSNAC